MMPLFRRRFLAALMILAIILGTPLCAQAAKRIYFAGYSGINIFPEQNFKEEATGVEGQIGLQNGASFAGAIGFKLTPQLRIEAEASYLKADFDAIHLDGFAGFPLEGQIESKIAMLNVYYDFDFNWKKIRPFIGAGVGYAWHEGDVESLYGFPIDSSSETSGYVWQVGAGFRYPLSKTLNLVSAYRYIDGQDLELDGYTIDYGTHEFRTGLSWDLPYK